MKTVEEIRRSALETLLPCVQTYQEEGKTGLSICGKDAQFTDGQWIYCGDHAPFLTRRVRPITDDEHIAIVLSAASAPSTDASTNVKPE